MELSQGRSKNSQIIRDYVPLSYNINGDWSQDEFYPFDGSMKMVISEEISKKEGVQRRSFGHISISSKSTRQLSSKLLYHDYKRSHPDDSYPWLEEPRRREHPQEEELQKFKKEFEAWQAAQARECTHEYLVSPDDSDDEKSFYADCYTTLNNWSTIHGFKEVPVVNSDCSMDKSSAPTRMVILRSGPDFTENDDESQATTSSTIEGRSSIVDFLEEVKERLKSELHGRPLKRNTTVRGGGIETPFSEKSSDTRSNYNRIPYHYRENIPSNVEGNLQISKSTRSYKSEIQFHDSSSPEFISKDPRRFTDRLRNALKNDKRLDSSAVIRGSPVPSDSFSEHGKFNLNKLAYQEKPNFLGNAKELAEFKNRNQSVRYGFNNEFMVNKEPSPGYLIRSSSAPVSGTSFANLVIEDHHSVTDEQLRRKHEQVNNKTVSFQRQQKERFNFREKVSTFRHSFTLRRKLFGKKLQTMKETNTLRHDFLYDMMSDTSVMMNFYDRHENSTEVPPSPASVCSSTYEEFWRPSTYASPLSTPGRRSVDAGSVPQAFRDISSNLSDLRRELKERDDQSASEDLFTEDMIDIKDPVESYIRDLLVASGLYDRCSHKHFMISDPEPINIEVFHEVEGKLKSNQEFDEDKKETKLDHMALLDLLNEKLPGILIPSSTMSKLGQEASGYSTWASPHGNKLLKIVWEIIYPYVHPPADKSCYLLNNMVSKDFQAISWVLLLDKEANLFGRELECWIIGDLIEEIVQDMRCVVPNGGHRTQQLI